MSTDTEQALALLFQRFREEEVSENDLVKVMSLTLSWTKPSRASNLLDRGVNAGLLDRDGDTYTARFDPGDVDVAFGFSPDEALFDPVPTAEEPATPPEPETGDEVEPEVDAAKPEATAQAEGEQEPARTPAETQPSAPGTATPTVDDGEDQALLEALLDRIEARMEDGDHNRAVAAVNARQDELGGLVRLDVAALLVAKELGLDVTRDAQAVLDQMAAA